MANAHENWMTEAGWTKVMVDGEAVFEIELSTGGQR